jgi:outer membrane protein assembly factor BamB
MTRGMLVLSGTVLALTTALAADEWPQFRGRQGGVAPDHPSLPDTWSVTENVAWTTAIPGHGWSSPIVWDDHILLTSAISSGVEPMPIAGFADPTNDNGAMRSTADQRWMLYDVDAQTGAIRWQRELHRGVPSIARHIRNSYATETPVTDGQRVYVYLGSVGVLAAVDLKGGVAWKKEIGAHESPQGWGMATSPVLHRDRLFIVSDNKDGSFIAAFDVRSGNQIWKVNREELESWSTPVVWEHAARTEIVMPGAQKVRSYGLDGSALWEFSGLSDFGPIPTPIIQHGLLFVSSGYPGSPRRPVFAIKPGASGDISLKPGETTNRFVAWSQPLLASYQTSGLVYGDYYYTLLDRGFLVCHDARTGEQIYSRQRIDPGSSFAASPWAYNGRVFALSEEGDTYVLQAGRQFKVLGKNALNEMVMATPAVADGSLFIRTQSKLYRITKGRLK